MGSGSHSLSLLDQQINLDAFATSPYTITVGGLDEGHTIPNVLGYHARGYALLGVAPTAVKDHIKFVCARILMFLSPHFPLSSHHCSPTPQSI